MHTIIKVLLLLGFVFSLSAGMYTAAYSTDYNIINYGNVVLVSGGFLLILAGVLFCITAVIDWISK